ncbi:ABC transporter ATP-binding protein [Lactobacillus sp. LC28-10]|uniref:ABC transporter ATP-binding protein n=1 Tax=Secundilactobacillus angelensis TaxID=2722706 RepID=A0ABX1L1Y7_9LACO|nr:ABC transporter ATP-binding protein [Secundilactobacillus angelensis]MCH5463443.1 energy-coupling factor ABC transporter ATP-binding protein [Secundilactobacillus angelensis]NLR18336.1 ABC transporter ATP-binding protein [Secundilactobacillus angelensis]
MANNQQISINDLSFTYRHDSKTVLHDISVSAPLNSIIGIIGNHNAGKTTLCRLLAGIIPNMMSGQLSGDIHIGNLSPTHDWSALNRQTGFVLQDPASQLSGLADTVADEIAFDLLNHGVAEAEIQRRVADVAAQLQLTAQLQQSPNSLSGGQLQRLAIATAIVTEPTLLILDNPTSEMDPQGRRAFFEWLRRIKNTTILLVSNEIDDLCEIADRLWLLADGELVSQGTPLEVINQLKSEWQIGTPKIYQLAKLMDWSLGADLFPVNINQLRGCLHDRDSN